MEKKKKTILLYLKINTCWSHFLIENGHLIFLIETSRIAAIAHTKYSTIKMDSSIILSEMWHKKQKFKHFPFWMKMTLLGWLNWVLYRKNRCGDLPIDAVAWMYDDVNVIAALRGLIRIPHDLFRRSMLKKHEKFLHRLNFRIQIEIIQVLFHSMVSQSTWWCRHCCS